MADFLEIKGAREHNLKNVDLKIPRDKLVVITGLSGSGKSSLAFDTIYAEGQRRYMESLNSYARQFLGTMDKPDVDQITGLSPAISIDQKSTSRNPRSTVATVTEIYDYLRLLFARIGTPHCPICGRDVVRRTPQSIVDSIMNLKEGSRLILLAPIAKAKKGEFAHIPEEFAKKGFARARVDGVIYALDEFPELEKNIKHNIEIVVDRLVLSKEMRTRLAQSVEQALEMTSGILEILNDETGEVKIFSQRYACELHPDEHIPELEPRLFSFNAPQGACETCSGLGTRMEIDPELVLSPNLTISEGAIRPYNRVMEKGYRIKLLEEIAKRHGFSTKVPTKKLSKEAIEIILYGTRTDEKYPIEMNGRVYNMNFEGVIPNLERRHRDTGSEFQRKDIERFMRVRKCQTCGGKRLKPVVLAVTVAGLNIVEICDLAIDEAVELFKNLELNEQQKFISTQILKEISSRLGFMNNVGLNYLELSRAANTLSGGEAQRIRLATQIGSGLQGVLYVLDEPSIGLHQRDNDKLIATLKNLRDLNNTVLVVEHDEDTIRAADWLVDVGPGAGVNGGMIVASGTPDEVSKNPKSLTGQFLSGKDKIQTPKKRRKIQKNEKLVIKNARENNLKNIDVEIPLGVMTVVSGVSGSGKSTLVNEILSKELLARKHRAQEVPGAHDEILGLEKLDKAIVIDQSAIGRTPRSNPATYTGVFTQIRELFAGTPEANIRGYKSGRFSFNVKGGRCENCQGDGVIKIEMHFLPDVYVECDVCHGKRYNREALEILYKGKTISDVLEMTIDEATEFFENIPAIHRKLLLSILNRLVDAGNSMVIIEHNLDIVKSADWLIDMGPEGGAGGGTVVATGTPERVSKVEKSWTGKYLKNIL